MAIKSDSLTELEKTQDLLKIEMEEDRIMYQRKMKQMNLAQKKEEGLAWYPLVIKDTYYGMGDRLIIELEKSYDSEAPSHFQTGKTVTFFSNYDPEAPNEIAGVISSVGQKVMKIVFFTDDVPEWAHKGKLGVELMFDESSYKEMVAAVGEVIRSKNNRVAVLREILLGYKLPSQNLDYEPVSLSELNEAQNNAVNAILQSSDVAIIHGPPGTGKTTTLVAAIQEVIKTESQVLVTAASNTAVDLLTEKIAAKGIRVLRIGNPARVNEDQLKHTVDVQVSSHKDYKRIKELRKSANDLRNIAGRYKRNFGRAEREQRRVIYQEARKLSEEAGMIENYIVEELLEEVEVITCTLVGSSNHLIADRKYSSVFIDEASQALEPATWIPILRAGRVIFAGDHKQLPPTVRSYEASKAGLSVTLFEKCIERQEVDVMLNIQYRMHERIMEFSNQKFYNGQLTADESIRNRCLGDANINKLFEPVSFIDTAGCSYSEEVEPKLQSFYNKEEAGILLNYLISLLDTLPDDGTSSSVGIISPYKAQVEYLKLQTENLTSVTGRDVRISVNTIDGFQGQERDIILISMVRSNESGEIGFLSDFRRMNVALTRAKKKLVVIGDSSTLGNNSFYSDFFTYLDHIGAYHSAWEYLNW